MSAAPSLSPVDQAVLAWLKFSLYVDRTCHFDTPELRQKIQTAFDLTGELLLPPSATFETKKEAGTNPMPHQYQNINSSPDVSNPFSRQDPSATSGLDASHATGPGAVAGQLRDRWQNQKEPDYLQYSIPGIAGPALVPTQASRAPRARATGYDYRNSEYYTVADRILQEAAQGHNLPATVLADCAATLAFSMAWCCFELFKTATGGEWMTLGVDRMRQELRIRSERLQSPTAEKAAQYSVFYILQSLGLMQIAKALPDGPERLPGAVYRHDFERMKAQAGRLPLDQGGAFFHARSLQEKSAMIYRLKGMALQAVTGKDVSLPDFNPFDRPATSFQANHQTSGRTWEGRGKDVIHNESDVGRASVGYESQNDALPGFRKDVGRTWEARLTSDSTAPLKEFKRIKRKIGVMGAGAKAIKSGEGQSAALTHVEKLDLIQSDPALNEIYGILANFDSYVPDAGKVSSEAATNLVLAGITFEEAKAATKDFMARRKSPQFDKYDNLAGFFYKELMSGAFAGSGAGDRTADLTAQLDRAKQRGETRRRRYQEPARPAAKAFPVAEAMSHIPVVGDAPTPDQFEDVPKTVEVADEVLSRGSLYGIVRNLEGFENKWTDVMAIVQDALDRRHLTPDQVATLAQEAARQPVGQREYFEQSLTSLSD